MYSQKATTLKLQWQRHRPVNIKMSTLIKLSQIFMAWNPNIQFHLKFLSDSKYFQFGRNFKNLGWVVVKLWQLSICGRGSAEQGLLILNYMPLLSLPPPLQMHLFRGEPGQRFLLERKLTSRNEGLLNQAFTQPNTNASESPCSAYCFRFERRDGSVAAFGVKGESMAMSENFN